MRAHATVDSFNYTEIVVIEIRYRCVDIFGLCGDEEKITFISSAKPITEIFLAAA